MRLWLAGLIALGLPLTAQAQDKPIQKALLADMFRDHAVLQRDRAVPVWGEAKPGETVTLSFGSARVTALTDATGHWRADLPPLPAGGPYVLTAATGTAKQTVSDVLVGDVFLCSGQSNMEWNLKDTIGAADQIATSQNNTLRMMTVQKTQAFTPQSHFATPTEWQIASPATTPNWSAVCYNFARDLQTHVNVPIGLINASWGGSKIQPWMSRGALQKLGGYEDGLAMLDAYAADQSKAAQTYGQAFMRWWQASKGPGTPWAVTPKALSGWAAAPDVSRNFEDWGVKGLSDYNGPLWYATTVRLSAAEAKQGATLSLGAIDDIDLTFVNGVAVGYTSAPPEPRHYKLAPGTLKAGDNVIVVQAVDLWAKGGMFGDAVRELRLANGTAKPLQTGWHYWQPPQNVRQPPTAPWDPTGGMITLHQAMIAPIGPYALTGALWYQGESNTGEAAKYEALMAGLMADWRQQFGPDTAFLLVQLANFGAIPTAPVESGWAGVREAQRLAALNDKRAAYAVTIDIGNPLDIHPRDKLTVGKRLSRAAQSLIYKAQLSPSGGVPIEATRANGQVTVRFARLDGALKTSSGDSAVRFELCGEGVGTCQYADARLAGDAVVLSGPSAAMATRVRYCWGDSPVCNLTDATLPVSPFEIDVK
ncbi:sialate O-acetylesterase [Asticcacaulis sp.]|uniref:sialate O-acetylesterase n=1 Tax=Asticcacaulis sp. TaxID=1872648 RepID=UPI003919A075